MREGRINLKSSSDSTISFFHKIAIVMHTIVEIDDFKLRKRRKWI